MQETNQPRVEKQPLADHGDLPRRATVLSEREKHDAWHAANAGAFADLIADGGLPEATKQAGALGVYRCRVCDTRWLLWPDWGHGATWNLLDGQQHPGTCCDNAPMGDQMEHLRDLPHLIAAAPDLLEACRLFVDAYTTPAFNHAIAKGKRAIAKAEGR